MNKLAVLLLCGLLSCTTPPGDRDAGNTETGSAPEEIAVAARTLVDVNPKQDARPLDAMIRVREPAVNATVRSPLVVEGAAVGPWYFEADFPVRLETAGGQVLAELPARAQGDWMTENFVPFRAEIPYTAPAGTEAWLILELNNPAGPDEGFIRSVKIPVVLE